MFNLQNALSAWKRSLRKMESFEEGTIAELESHILDEVDRQKRNGLSEEDAFRAATKLIGRPEEIGGEYFRESRRSPIASPSWQTPRFSAGLLLNYVKVAFRTFRRHAGYSLINITGLAIGMACALMIVLWVRGELSYDRFHQNGRDIYRVVTYGKHGNDFSSPAPFAPAVTAEIPEVVAAVRVVRVPRVTLQSEKRVFYEDGGITTDAALFKVFTFPLISGDVDSAFAVPDAIILSSSLARKYFGDDDPIGKILRIEGEYSLKVAGVMQDIPRQSHFRFDYVLPFKFVEANPFVGMEWGDFNFKTYIQTRPQRDEAEIIRKLNQVALAHHCPQIERKMASFSIQRLHDIYLNPIGPYDIPLGSKTYVYLFSLIAFFVILIAGINFINLSTARAEKRAKEIGLRKVIGADRRQLVVQFFGESLLITGLSLPLALILAGAAIPFFNEWTGKEFSAKLFSADLLIALAVIAGLIGLLAGAFPALYLSAIRPIQALRESKPARWFGKGRKANLGTRGTLRRILVTSQFVISITLILATFVVGSQLRLIREKSWHLDNDQILTLPMKENIGRQYEAFRSELLKNPAIANVSIKDSLPTRIENNTTGVSWEGKTEDQKTILMETIRVDVGYFETMGMAIAAGRGFSAAFPGDRETAFILNEKAVEKAGLKDPVGKLFALDGKKGTIVGVVKNTLFLTLRQDLGPQVFHLFEDIPQQSGNGAVLIRLKNGRPLAAAVNDIQKVWKSFNSVAPFEYHFLDQLIEDQYGSEKRLGKLFGIFALLAVFISCLGLFGLVAFMAERRTKEIGIRKVLGASVPGIMVLLSMDFAKQVLLANLLAWPLAYWLLGKWLQGFVYHASIGAGLFLFSGSLVLVLAFMTIGFQSLAAARMNPADSLRSE